MGYLLDSLVALASTLRNVLRRPTTVQFPAQVRPRPERYRTSFALLHDEHGDELCIGCLQCERICPSRVIQLVQAPKRESPVTGKKRGYCSDFTLDLEACVFCELCVQVCPEDAIVMTKSPETPAFSREDLVLTMDRLYENEKKHAAAWSNGTRLMEMQDPARGQPKPEKKAKAKAPPAAAASPSAAPPAPAPVKEAT